MKPSNQRAGVVRRRRSQELAETHIAAIFELMPVLAGFTLRADLEVTDIEISTWPGYTPRQELYEELMQALVDLAEERPDTIEVIRGRTFARTFH